MAKYSDEFKIIAKIYLPLIGILLISFSILFNGKKLSILQRY
ncbi:hypothetical protein MKY37_01195 [Psychrobacillus sp. FSL K6-2836]